MTSLRLALLLVLVGCSKDRPAARPTAPHPVATVPATAAAQRAPDQPAATPATGTPDPAVARFAERLLGEISELGTDLEAAKGDCKKMAAAIQASSVEVRPLLADAQKLPADPATQQWLQQNYAPKIVAASERVAVAGEPCAKDPAVREAMKTYGL